MRATHSPQKCSNAAHPAMRGSRPAYCWTSPTGIKQRYQPDPFGNWKSHLTQRILELAAAVSTGEPLMFSSRVLWSRKAFLARNQDEMDLVISLSALRDVLAENLPAAANKEALAYLQEAMDMLSGEAPVIDDSELDPKPRA